MTRDEFISDLVSDVQAAMPTNATLTSSNMKIPLNAALSAIENAGNTVDPSKPPTVKHLTDIEYK